MRNKQRGWVGYPVIGTFAAIVLLLGVVWLIQGGDFFIYRFFAPKYEAVRRQTFEQSKAYNEGMLQELQSMEIQYYQAKNQNEKDALASAILHRASEYDIDKLPDDLRGFVTQLKNERMRGN